LSNYEGKENLDIMFLATNYNNTIYKWLIKDCDTDRNSILDFGAGMGEFCNRFKNDITAVEIDKSMHGKILCEVLEDISMLNRKVDFIYSSNVLEHIDNDKEVIKNFYEYLDMHGHIKVLVPARMELYSNMDKSVGHYRRYSIKELREKFESVGFKVEYCKYFDFVGYFAALLFKHTSNSCEISPRSLILYDRLVFPLSSFIDFITGGKIIGKNIILKAKKSVH